jgi:hypothetical protein
VVDHDVFLLEGGLVLLIHDDQAKVGKGQEQRAARADDHRRLPVRDGAPGIAAGARRKLGMPQRRAHLPPRQGCDAEAAPEAVQPLRRQRNLRQQHQGLPPLPDAFGNGFQIDLGLAGARDAGQQRHTEVPRRRLGAQLTLAGELIVQPPHLRCMPSGQVVEATLPFVSLLLNALDDLGEGLAQLAREALLGLLALTLLPRELPLHGRESLINVP